MINKIKIIFVLLIMLAGLSAANVSYTAKDKISLQGKANRNVKIEIFVNNNKTAESHTDDNGDWTAYDVPLEANKQNEIFAIAVGADGNRSRTSTRLSVIVDTTIPQISALEFNPPQAKPEETVQVTVRTDRANIQKVNAVMPDSSTLALSGGNGVWTGSWQVPRIISGGSYKVLVTAVNRLGTTGQFSGDLQINAEAGLSISSPEENAVLYADSIEIKGMARNSVQVEINNQRYNVQADGAFTGLYVPQPGRNQIAVAAIDPAGGKTEQTLNIIKLITFPDIQVIPERREIEYLATLGYVQAYPNSGIYAPEQNITRAELAALLVRARRLPVGGSYNKPIFDDVYGNSWAAGYIDTAARYGVVEGYPGHVYKPSNLVTRAEAAMMFTRYANVPLQNVRGPVDIDVSADHWAASSIAALKSSGLIPQSWQNQQRFYPEQPITRAEVAAILARVKDINRDIETLLGKNPELDVYTAQSSLPPPISLPQTSLPQSSASAPPAEAGAVILAVVSPRDALPGNDLFISAATMQKMRHVSAILPNQNELPLQYNPGADMWESSWRIPANQASDEYQIEIRALAENGSLYNTRTNFFNITDDKHIAQSFVSPDVGQSFPDIQTNILPYGYVYPPSTGNVNIAAVSTGNLTRAEAAVILGKHGYLKQAIVNAPPAKDIPMTHPQVKVIKSAIVTGIIPNKKPGQFVPNDPVTYQEAAAILRRAKIAETAKGEGIISAAEFDRLATKR